MNPTVIQNSEVFHPGLTVLVLTGAAVVSMAAISTERRGA